MYNLSAPLFIFKFVFLAQIVIAEILIAYRMKKKSNIALRFFVAIISLIAITFALPVPYYNAIYSAFLFLIIFLCTLVAMWFCIDESWGGIVFCGFFSYNQQHISFQLYNLGCIMLGMDANQSAYGGDPSLLADGFQSLVFVVSNVLVYTFCWAFMAFRMSNRKDNLFYIRHIKGFILAVIVVILNVSTYTFVAYNMPSDLPDFVGYLTIYYNIFACVLALIMLLSVVGQEELESELKVIENLWRKNERTYELSKVNIDFINMKCHDLRHRIRNARTKENVDDEELEEIEQAINIYDSFLKTGNEVLDVILSEESIFCNKNNIKLLCNVDGACLGFIRQADLYSIFQNGIHNAVDAVMKIDDEEKRIIRVNVKQVESMVSINIENYTNGEEEIKFVDGLPVSKNSDDNLHGFGMRSIKVSVERYGGCLCVDLKDDIFYMNAMIPINENNSR